MHESHDGPAAEAAVTEELTVHVRGGTLRRFLAVADNADVTVESLVGDALDFYLDGVGA